LLEEPSLLEVPPTVDMQAHLLPEDYMEQQDMHMEALLEDMYHTLEPPKLLPTHVQLDSLLDQVQP